MTQLDINDTNLGGEEFREIASALNKQPQIEHLNLLRNDLGRDGSALEGLRHPNLSMLNLGYNNIDDEGLHALVDGLRSCHNLKSLHLSGNDLITKSGLQSLSTLFQSDHCRLECLDLNMMNIDNDGVGALAYGLLSLSSLTQLSISLNRIGDQGLQDLLGALIKKCNLEEFHLSRNMLTVPALGLRSLGNLV